MTKFDLNTALEDCIFCLQHGMNLEAALKRYPGHEQDLRPLVETAWWMRSAGNQQVTLTSNLRAAQARSRMNFTRPARLSAPAPALFPVFHLRLAASLTIFAILVFALLGTGMASVSALPGDAFYPVKLAVEQAQMNLASDPSERIQLIESYDQRRSDDVNQLKGSGRLPEVDFSGALLYQNGEWEVSSIHLLTTPDQAEQLPALEGMIIEVIGRSNGETVQVDEIKLRQINFSGLLTQIQPEQWVIGGVKVALNDSTQITGNPVLGGNVEVIAGRLANGQMQAISMVISKPQKDSPVFPTQPSTNRSPEPEDGQDGNGHPTSKPNTPDASTEPTDAPDVHRTEIRSSTEERPRMATPMPKATEQSGSEHKTSTPRPSDGSKPAPTKSPTPVQTSSHDSD